MRLTDTHIRNAKPKEKPYKLTDEKGLYVEVRPRGSKLWRYRYRINGRENVYALGEYPDVGLVEAREERKNARALVKQGLHPAHVRKMDRARHAAEQTNTFEAVAQEWIEKRRPSWIPYYARQVVRFQASDVFQISAAFPSDLLRRRTCWKSSTV